MYLFIKKRLRKIVNKDTLVFFLQNRVMAPSSKFSFAMRFPQLVTLLTYCIGTGGVLPGYLSQMM